MVVVMVMVGVYVYVCAAPIKKGARKKLVTHWTLT